MIGHDLLVIYIYKWAKQRNRDNFSQNEVEFSSDPLTSLTPTLYGLTQQISGRKSDLSSLRKVVRSEHKTVWA